MTINVLTWLHVKKKRMKNDDGIRTKKAYNWIRDFLNFFISSGTTL